ncbi:LysM peptidoglycan-binding domain-containing protein [Intrasporangium sp.]|uniref:LysM peptidoglycan-binding domain-containing protein n=1 Tax=Intrasporangium sp. TaxID=1925024 RepID=UPI0029395755|nr:LysM peptidoglycan-binding domain-containing protein [Intrasporangium sp.]MDV3222796.1 LysM peptidoglycan-binding domain-containing protein [Intrasporangium sp.]
MGAQVLHLPVSAPPAPAPRPRLVLVPSPAPEPLPEPAYRLTRRGRVVTALLAAIALTVALLAVAGQLASAAGEPRSVSVRSGQTLSEIAARELPQLPIVDGIVEIQLANNLSTAHVHAGQTLVIPDL